VRLTEQLAKNPQQIVAFANKNAVFAQCGFIGTKYNKEFFPDRFE
jgi:hypothetical protein